MHGYSAYGLTIRSALVLPELLPADADTDADSVVLRLGHVPHKPSPADDTGYGFFATADEACHYLESVGAFLVRKGREIVVDPVPGVEDRVLRLSILGPALALVLLQRGFLVLHASVVAREEQALLVLGQSGWGKSTIAAALYAKGYEVVADDVAAVTDPFGVPHVIPGFPQLKVWPEAAELLGQSPGDLPLLHPRFDKRAWGAARGFSSAPRRLSRAYVIAPGSVPAIEPIDARQACFELLTHWYGHRFGPGVIDAGAAALRFRQCAALAAALPLSRVIRSGGPSTLLQLADLIDYDLCRETAKFVRTESSAP